MDTEQKRLFLAVALSAVVLFGWQAIFGPGQKTQGPGSEGRGGPSQTLAPPPAKGLEFSPSVPGESAPTGESLLEGPQASLRMGDDLSLVDYSSPRASFPFRDIVGSPRAFDFFLINENNELEKVRFSLRKSFSDGETLVGYNEGHDLRVTVSLVGPGQATVHLSSPRPFRYRLAIRSNPGQREDGQSRQFVSFSQDMETYDLDESTSTDTSLRWFGVDFNYHLFVVTFQERHPLRLRTSGRGLLVGDAMAPVGELSFDLLFTRKDYDYLESLGNGLHMAVDFGIFGILGVPILRGLQWFYGHIPNYGVGIILLTILIRIITFPLQYKSFKSMKKMQVIGPELQKLKEKFQDDPQRMQQETMALFKRSGANPLGGCLPLLLQMPILFAFYQVLYNAVELVGAPFVAHITDLSEKDPFYILPVLCTLSMFLNQKLTPTATATDPLQKKIMLFLPFFFGLIMKDLPAGLVLYIVVSTLFGIVQQLFVYKITD